MQFADMFLIQNIEGDFSIIPLNRQGEIGSSETFREMRQGTDSAVESLVSTIQQDNVLQTETYVLVIWV